MLDPMPREQYSRLTPKGQAIVTLCESIQACQDNIQVCAILRNAIRHIAEPMWVRQWPSAVPEE